MVEPIAVVGMSCRFPRAENIEQFWSLLESGEVAITDVPKERWDISKLYDDDHEAVGKMSTRYGGFLKDIDKFDAHFFNISPREAMLMDPQQRLLLEVAWEAIEDAAISPDKLYGSAAGVFMGICTSDYGRLAGQDIENLNAYWGTGHVSSVAAGRIAYTFGLKGPCIALDTACSSALVALHAACDSLRKGECDSALAGSVNLILAPDATIAFSKAKMMSPDGRCKAFDDQANGYVRSEGGAVLVLKTLSKAREDGDRIHALVRGSAINHDGASGGLTVPNGPSQQKLIQDALLSADIGPDEISLIEAHGTGTPLGDPIEVGALSKVFKARVKNDQAIMLGSVKSVIGHLEIAAGMAGIIKTILMMKNETVPGYKALGDLNRHIHWDHLPFEIPRQDTLWTRSEKPRIAGISAFGFSGTNAHVVVQEAPPVAESKMVSSHSRDGLFSFSAKQPESLISLAQSYVQRIDAVESIDLDALSWTVNTGRANLPHRMVIQASTADQLKQLLNDFIESPKSHNRVQISADRLTDPALAFLFSGQGTQYPEMGRELYKLQPIFKTVIDQCDDFLDQYFDISLKQVLWGEKSDALDETRYAQPAIFSLQIALARLWESWGVMPSYVMGHSVGEFAAACVAGIFSLEDGLKLIAERGRLMHALESEGSMLVIHAGADRLINELVKYEDELSIAAINTPNQTVVSGATKTLLNFSDDLEARLNIKNGGLLKVSHAFHSPLMRPMLDDFRTAAQSVEFFSPELGFVSNVTGELAGENEIDAEYWVNHVLAPVDFRKGIGSIRQEGVDKLVEIGSQATLLGLAKACAEHQPFLSVPSMRKNVDDWTQILQSLAALYVSGVDVDWEKAGRCDVVKPRKLSLPSYPFERKRFWFSASQSGSINIPQSVVAHPLLGRRLYSAVLAEGDFQYEVALDLEALRFLSAHRVFDKVVVPAAAYVEVVLAAVNQQFSGKFAEISSISIQNALVIVEGSNSAMQSVFSDIGDNRYRFKIYSIRFDDDGQSENDSSWQLHAAGEVSIHEESQIDDGAEFDLETLIRESEAQGESKKVDDFYNRYQKSGINYGEEFRTVSQLTRFAQTESQPTNRVLAKINLSAAIAKNALTPYLAHPTLIDGCFQSLAALYPDLEDGLTYLPIGIERVRLLAPLSSELWAYSVSRRDMFEDASLIVADIVLMNEQGQTIGVIEGLQGAPVDKQALIFSTAPWKDSLYQTLWVAQKLGSPTEDLPIKENSWLILNDDNHHGEVIAENLKSANQNVILVQSEQLSIADKESWKELISTQIEQQSSMLTGVINLWALDANAFSTIEQSQLTVCASTLALVQALLEMPERQAPKLWFVSQNGQSVIEQESVQPFQSMLWGFVRSLALENPSFRPCCIDIDQQLKENLAPLTSELLDSGNELQIAYRNDKRFVARLANLRSLKATDTLAIPDEPYQLRVSKYGSFDQLSAISYSRPELAQHEIEIEVCAAALNFKDVLFCLGMLKEYSEEVGITSAIDQPLGFECAGRVKRVGSKVGRFNKGDRVFAMAPSALASHTIIDQDHAQLMPDTLSFEGAASLSTVFMTAIYSLKYLAKLREGETVLIHACAGGVGQAALQVAKQVGANVIATASKGKWNYLKSQGVEYVMDSRSLDFSEQILELTKGRGVDVVINSLNGEYIEKTAVALAENGRFIEIGKIGIWSKSEMNQFRSDIQYHSFDLGDIENSSVRESLLKDVLVGLESKQIKPIPIRQFPVENSQAAFRYLMRARNIGKVVISIPKRVVETSPVNQQKSYLVTGGCGDLGLRVARLLVKLGAGQIVLASRSQANQTVIETVKSLTELGAEIVVRQMDVSDSESVTTTLSWMSKNLSPLGGVVHAAGILDDGLISTQSWQRFSNVLSPKVLGSWNLHLATQDIKLDFFVMFSSIASVFGAPGQANYACANAFMDGLVDYRRELNLEATSINWGPWGEIGMAEKTLESNTSRFNTFGLSRMPVDDNLEVLEQILAHKPKSVTVAKVNWPKYIKALGNLAVANFYSNLDRTSSIMELDEMGVVAKQLNAMEEEARAPFLQSYLQQQIAHVVGMASLDDVHLNQPLFDFGIDSLMAVELKNRTEMVLNCTLNTTVFFDYPTIAELSSYLISDVLKMPGSSSETINSTDITETTQTGVDHQILQDIDEHFVSTEKRRLCVCSWGDKDSKKVAVCVHGVLDQAPMWDQLASGLVQAGYRVVAPDLRGHGRSDHHPSGTNFSVLDFLADLELSLKDVEADEILLIGHSMGSVVASLYAANNPEKISLLVLLEPVLPHLREIDDPIKYLETECEYRDKPPPHPVYQKLSEAASMLTLSHRKLDSSRALALAERITETPAGGGFRWTWDARLRNPMGIDLFFTRKAYKTLVRELAVPSIRLYGRSSQFANSRVLLADDEQIPRSVSKTIDGGHNLQTDSFSKVITTINEFDSDNSNYKPKRES